MPSKLLEYEQLLAMLGVKNEEGWYGSFSRKEYPGAIPNGTLIQKVKGDSDDCHDIGKTGRVLGSIQPLPTMPICYFVEWDGRPKVAVAVMDWKIAPVKQ